MNFPRYERYKDSGVEWLGEVPEHWQIERLKTTVQRCKNGVWGHDEAGDEWDIPCVRVTDFDRDKLRVQEVVPTLRNVIDSDRHGRILRKGDLLLEKSGGGDLQPVGCVVLYDHDQEAVCSNFVARMQLASGMSASYCRYLHASLYGLRLTTRSINQTSGIQNLDQYRYLCESFALPTHEEQVSIAAFLEEETAKIHALIEEQRRLIELLKEKRQAVISHAVTKGLNPKAPMKDSGIEWLGEIPTHWTMSRIHHLFRQEKRQLYADKPVLSVYRDYGVILKNSRDDNMNKTPEDLSAYQLVNPHDLVVNKMKAWQGSLGISKLEGITSPDYVVFTPRHNQRSTFLHFLFRSQRMVSVYRSISNGIRPAQWRLEPDVFLGLPVFLPPVIEQEDLTSFIENQTLRYDELTSEAEKAIEVLQERRSALISAAVTGKIDVRPQPPKEAA